MHNSMYHTAFLSIHIETMTTPGHLLETPNTPSSFFFSPNFSTITQTQILFIYNFFFFFFFLIVYYNYKAEREISGYSLNYRYSLYTINYMILLSLWLSSICHLYLLILLYTCKLLITHYSAYHKPTYPLSHLSPYLSIYKYLLALYYTY